MERESLLVFPLKGWESPPAALSPPSPTPHPVKQVHSAAASWKQYAFAELNLFKYMFQSWKGVAIKGGGKKSGK